MEFQVNTNQVILAQINQVESGEYNVTECSFIFSSEYEGLTKKAVFTGEDGIAYLQTIVNNKCSIPSEILATSQVVQIGVYAYAVENEELILRYSPEPTDFFIHEGSYKEAQNSTPPTPSEIEQLQAQITTNANDIDTLETDVGNIQGDIANIEAEQITQNEDIQTNTDNISTINGQILAINADIDNLENTKADKSEIPTKTSDLINDSDFVVDNNYVHTDNNFTNEDKGQIKTNKDDISTINGNIQNINNSINDINQNIDDLEQDLTNYSLITETGSQIELNINSSDFKLKAILKDKNGNTIYTSNIIDLPLETMVVGASYDNTTKEVILTLQNGTTIRFSVADLVSGLVSTDELTQILSNYYNKTEVNNLLANHYTKSETDTLLNEKANQTSLDTTNQNLTNLTGRVSTNEEDIADIKEEQTTQNTNIEELQNQVETLQTDLDNANAEIEELNTDITNMAKAMYKVDGQGSDITLENTSENKFVEFELSGRTEQEQLSGKNLLDIELPFNTNASNYTQKIARTIPKIENGKTYILSGICTDGTILNGNASLILSGDGYQELNVPFGRSFVNTADMSKVVLAYIFFTDIFAGKTIKEIQLEQGTTATSYEPYCGGIPSPNPDFPQQIKNVTGNANVKIQNKNLLKTTTNYNTTLNGVTATTNSDGTITLNGTATRNTEFKFMLDNEKIILKANKNYMIQRTLLEGVASNILITYYLNTTVGTFSNENKNLGESNNERDLSVIRIFCNTNDTFNNAKIGITVYEGSTATSYVPHAEQNYPFTFAQSQRGMQGTTLEDDGIHNTWKKVVFDGTENWRWNDTKGGAYCDSFRNIIYSQAKSYANAVCNYFILNKNQTWVNNHFGFNDTGTTIWFLNTSKFSSLTEWTSWLAEQYANGTPVIVEYELATEETISYQGVQQSQYNAIKQARSYDDMTIISSESDELGFNMDVESLANANKAIDSLDTRLLALESEV